METINLDFSSLEQELTKVVTEKVETDLDIRRGELMVKKLNALANLEKTKLDLMRLQLQQRSLELDERRLALDEIQGKYNIISDMVRKSDKTQRAIGKTMVGFFPEQDQQVIGIMQAAKRLQEITDKPQ